MVSCGKRLSGYRHEAGGRGAARQESAARGRFDLPHLKLTRSNKTSKITPTGSFRRSPWIEEYPRTCVPWLDPLESSHRNFTTVCHATGARARRFEATQGWLMWVAMGMARIFHLILLLRLRPHGACRVSFTGTEMGTTYSTLLELATTGPGSHRPPDPLWTQPTNQTGGGALRSEAGGEWKIHLTHVAAEMSRDRLWDDRLMFSVWCTARVPRGALRGPGPHYQIPIGSSYLPGQ
ncbi:unnamed protein product [Boreogadus saida]